MHSFLVEDDFRTRCTRKSYIRCHKFKALQIPHSLGGILNPYNVTLITLSKVLYKSRMLWYVFVITCSQFSSQCILLDLDSSQNLEYRVLLMWMLTLILIARSGKYLHILFSINLWRNFPSDQSLDDVGRLQHDGRVPVPRHDQQLRLQRSFTIICIILKYPY